MTSKNASAVVVGGDATKGRERSRSSNLFMIRLTPAEIYKGIREDVRDALPPSVSWLIALERDGHSGRYSHLHLFLRTVDKWLLKDLCDYFKSIFGELCLYDVQKCRSERNALKYCSKEDKNLLTNVSSSKLNLYYQANEWCRKSSKYSYNDPFVFSQRFNYKFFQNMFSEVQKSKVPPFRGFRTFGHSYCPWADEVTRWWNNKLQGWYHKQKNLYLWGEKNMGKSKLIEKHIGKVNRHFVFYPDVGKFALGDLDPDFHQIIVFEEFKLQYHCVSMLKRLLEGSPFRAPQKFTAGQVIEWRKPVVFVSNDMDIEDDALLCRLKVVNCDEPYYRRAPSLFIDVKEEVDEEEEAVEEAEVIEVSSEEEMDDDFV